MVFCNTIRNIDYQEIINKPPPGLPEGREKEVKLEINIMNK